MKVDEIRKGMIVWIPCEVRVGPFPDERKVYVPSATGDWFGFVNISELDKKVLNGEDRVRGVVLAIESNGVLLGINGQSPASKGVTAKPSLIEHAAL
jgi:hypothetical protein